MMMFMGIFVWIVVINRNIADLDDEVYSAKVPADVLYALRFNGHRIGVEQEQDAFEVFQLISSVLNQEVEKSIRKNADVSLDSLDLDTSTDSSSSEESLCKPLSWMSFNGTGGPIDAEDMTWGYGPDGDWIFLGRPMFRTTKGIHSRRVLSMKCDYTASPKPPFRFTMFSQMKCIACMTKVKLETYD